MTVRPGRMAICCGVAAAAAVTLAAAPATANHEPRVVSAGPLADYATATAGPFDDAEAKATISPRWRGSTITFRVKGIDRSVAGTSYGAHLHLGPCLTDDPAAALGHYNTDVLAGRIPPRVSPRTEVWLDFTVSRSGRGWATAPVPFVPEAGNRAIVIHAEPTHPDGTAGARLACLPLVWAP